MQYRIRNWQTGETLALSRDVTTDLPQWVYEQTETQSPSELQAMLDQYGPDAVGQGEDVCGITVEA